MESNTAPNLVRGSKVDMLSTKDLDMKQRRVINASAGVQDTDYTTLSQVNSLLDQVNTSMAVLQSSLNKSIKSGTNPLVTSIIKPPTDSLTAIQITEANGTTALLVFDTATPSLNLISTTVTISAAGGKIAFFTTDPTHAVLKQILAAYTSNNRSAAFAGIANSVTGTPYAQVSDLNTLRVAYENLRIMCEDLRSKLQNSTLVG